jgi:3-oxoacyl-[acyl-carrier protein] reductase
VNESTTDDEDEKKRAVKRGGQMDLEITNKVAWVGGASQGLGLAVCERLAAQQVRLAMVARGEERLVQEASRLRSQYGIQVLAIAADQSRADEIARISRTVRREMGLVDILVHNTGGPPPGAFLTQDDAAWQGAYEGLLMSVVRACREVLPSMTDRGWGRIILNTSFTVREPEPNLILSNVFRTGVVALAKTLSREVAGQGVTVNCVLPGPFDTERLRCLFEAQAQSTGRTREEVRAEWQSRVPLGRLLEPQELGDLVTFLASDRASGITGTAIPIDGGLLHESF